MHECLLLLPLCSSLPPQSVLCSAEPARVLGPLLREAITLLAGLLLGRQAKKSSSQALTLQRCPLLAQGDFFFFQAAAFVAQAHMTSTPVKERGQEEHWEDSGTCSFLLGTTTAGSPPAVGARWGHSR